jgi:hypothetical protein
MKLKHKVPRQLAKLGVTKIETIAETQRRHTDLVLRLQDASVPRRQYEGLEDCSFDHCGRVNCIEVCHFATRRRRLQEIVATCRLLKKVGGRAYEVRVTRASWTQPAGNLRKVSIAAAKQLNRRALDKLYNPNIVAIGTFKLVPPVDQSGDQWQPEIHLIVAGATREELERAYSGDMRIDKVQHIGQTISEVLRRDLEPSQHTCYYQPTPKKAQRTEYYEWVQGLAVGVRMIRYGCDRYFNPLKKQPRVFRPKLPKKRPYPIWLAFHMFGSHAQNCNCLKCQSWQRHPSYLTRGLPGPRRAFEPSNLRATSLRYQVRMVSGRATVATSPRTLRPRR